MAHIQAAERVQCTRKITSTINGILYWLFTHWGETIASTSAVTTTTYLEKILSKNGSTVLYMVHDGTSFGFYNGANTGDDESEYKPDLTSYDYVRKIVVFLLCSSLNDSRLGILLDVVVR